MTVRSPAVAKTAKTSAQQPGQTYPLDYPESGDDSRFTFGLMVDVADVLAKHGYPDIRGVDFVDLRACLFQFIYGTVGERR